MVKKQICMLIIALFTSFFNTVRAISFDNAKEISNENALIGKEYQKLKFNDIKNTVINYLFPNVEFDDIKDDLVVMLDKYFESQGVDSDNLTLLPGFLLHPLFTEVSEIDVASILRKVPMVCVYENSTGKMHFFVLGALMPELKIFNSKKEK